MAQRAAPALAWGAPIVALLLLTWGPGGTPVLWAFSGLDPSWHAGLAMAAHSGLAFGPDLDFSYGPLGFLDFNEAWFGDTLVLAFAYRTITHLAFVAAVFWVARRDYGMVGGLLVALVVCSIAGGLLAGALLIVAVRMVHRGSTSRATQLLVAAAGALAAIELLVKLSDGLELVALTAATAVAVERSRARHYVVGAGAFCAALLVGWLAAGQPLGAMPDYLRYGAQTILGYAGAMQLESPALGWQHSVALIGFCFGVAGLLQMTATASRRRRMGLLALWLVFCFFSFKEAFVRHDDGHGAVAFVTLVGGFVAFRWPRGRRWLGLGLLSALVAFFLAAQNRGISAVVTPRASVSSAFDQLRTVVSASRREQVRRNSLQGVRTAEGLDPQTLSLLQGHTVHVYPVEAAVAWAYHLRWRPLPDFQFYSAYTSELDQLNASFLSSRRAPERILEQFGASLDARVVQFDEAATTRALLCRYYELRTTLKWQVLARGGNRCSRPGLIASVRAGWGQPVTIPPLADAHSAIYVRIHGVAVAGLERLRAFFYKPYERHIRLDGASRWLVAATAGDGLVIRAAPSVDFTPPFAVAPNPRTIAVTKQGQSGPGGHPLTYDFYRQPFTAGPRSGK